MGSDPQYKKIWPFLERTKDGFHGLFDVTVNTLFLCLRAIAVHDGESERKRESFFLRPLTFFQSSRVVTNKERQRNHAGGVSASRPWHRRC
jgi:hypothetical protein